MQKTKPMRTVILEAIQAGGATKDSLLKLADTTPKGLSSQFTYLRMMGHCPMLQEDGTYKIVSAEEWENHREEVSRNSASRSLSPEKRVEKATKRLERAEVALTNSTARAEKSPDSELYGLQKSKAEIELRIAQIELSNAQEILAKGGGGDPGDAEDAGDDLFEDEETGDETMDADELA